MGNTTELDRDDVKTEDDAGRADSEKTGTAHLYEGGGAGETNRGEGRVVERLRRAKLVAWLAVPELRPSLEDLIELAELIEDEGG